MTTIPVVQQILSANDAIAAENRAALDVAGALGVNVMASPGAGKTSLILATARRLPAGLRLAVVEGDVAGRIDADTMAAASIPVVQINTGGGCHLDAPMVRSALPHLLPEGVDVLMVENVGNLICPAEFALGTHVNLVVASTAEGHDKPYKYPGMFAAADVVALNKADVAAVFDFDFEAFQRGVRMVNPQAPIFVVSCRTGDGLDAWVDWLVAACHAELPAQHRLSVEIHGAVQGVGFRPFVYRLATELGLAGWVLNDTAGVFIEVEGDELTLAEFLRRLPAEPPPRALIQSLDAAWLAPAGYQRFEIRHSDGQGSKTVLVLPDIATCPDCLREVLDPADRRHGYPFTNCTNCGPRFSIIQALPYDRPNTTMQRFVMCPACQAEYDSPLDRRFHAQPNACPVCGPQVAVWDAQDQAGADVSSVTSLAEGGAALRLAAAALCQGQIVAVKGLGGFHLMVDAGNAEAVARLRRRKQRYEKPLALMVRDLAAARRLVAVDEQAAALLASAEAPIVLLPRRPEAPAAANVAPGNPTLGVMLAYAPLHHLLLDAVARSETGQSGARVAALVATSGNLSDEPICIDNDEAVQRLGPIADLFLVHDRPIERHVDDSVAWIVESQPRLLRRARGYAPLPVLLAQPMPTILAVGAHLKNTVALSVGRQVFISQHIGDMETAEAMAAFERVIADFLRLYEAAPVAIAHDMHPDYLSTRWAKENDEFGTMNDESGPDPEDAGSTDHRSSFIVHRSSLVAVQHHHAHLAACLAENGVSGPALGVTWDGTGYGLDGTIWGGEFLLGDAADFVRVAHLRPFRLPGGDAAVKGPRRVALALLWELYGEAALGLDDLAAIRTLPASERLVLGQMLRRGLSAPITTSAGRLFDGVAALLGLHPTVSFEGQAAMALEYAADPAVTDAYPLGLSTERAPTSSSFIDHHSSLLLDWQPLIEALLLDLRNGISAGILAARFHNGLAAAIVAVAEAIGQPQVALTGGCFQNRLLLERTASRLRQAGFDVLLHRQVPPNDGGISLGQVAVAAARLNRV